MITSSIALLDRTYRVFLTLLLGLMVVCVTWQIVSRYLLGDPSPWTEELARFLLIWIGLLGGSYAYHAKMHLGLDLLKEHLHGKFRLAQELAIHLLVILFSASVLIYGGLRIVRMTNELKQYSAALGLPMSVVYYALPISGLMLVFYASLAIYETLQSGAEEVHNG